MRQQIGRVCCKASFLIKELVGHTFRYMRLLMRWNRAWSISSVWLLYNLNVALQKSHLAVELTKDEAYSLFLKLERIQEQLDALTWPHYFALMNWHSVLIEVANWFAACTLHLENFVSVLESYGLFGRALLFNETLTLWYELRTQLFLVVKFFHTTQHAGVSSPKILLRCAILI